MFDLSQIFIATAQAQTAAGSPPGGSNTSMLMNFVPIILIFGVFYILIIRPQQKRMDEQNKMIKALQRGDRVITSGGIHGKITKVDGDDLLTIEIADGVNIKVARSHISGLAAKTQPVTTPDGDEAEKKK